jgi:hypothetical protein
LLNVPERGVYIYRWTANGYVNFEETSYCMNLIWSTDCVDLNVHVAHATDRAV